MDLCWQKMSLLFNMLSAAAAAAAASLQLCPTVQPHRWQPTRLLCPWDSPGKTTGKTIPLTRWTFVGKVMSLLLNMLSRLVITFLPRSKPLLISWLQSPSAVILEPQKIKSDTVSTVSPSISHEVMGPDASWRNNNFLKH